MAWIDTEYCSDRGQNVLRIRFAEKHLQRVGFPGPAVFEGPGPKMRQEAADQWVPKLGMNR